MEIPTTSGHERVKKILEQAYRKGRVPSAYLFVGPDEDKMLVVATEFAKLLNCEERGKHAGECAVCSKMDRGVHPDFHVIGPDGASIGIDQIRELSSFSRFGPSEGTTKVLVVKNADRMTGEAYTSFLKTLEEAINGVLFILITSREDHVPDTVSSRCQKIIFPEAAERALMSDDDRAFCSGLLGNIRSFDDGKLLDLWNERYETEDLKDMLKKLMYYIGDDISRGKGEQAMIRAGKAVASCYNSLERKANARLALDVMFLNMKEALYGG